MNRHNDFTGTQERISKMTSVGGATAAATTPVDAVATDDPISMWRRFGVWAGMAAAPLAGGARPRRAGGRRRINKELIRMGVEVSVVDLCARNLAR
jgi:hypothetical protein